MIFLCELYKEHQKKKCCKLILVSSVGRAFDFYTAAVFSCKSSKGIEMSGVRAPYEEFTLPIFFAFLVAFLGLAPYCFSSCSDFKIRYILVFFFLL